jgi:hypothetical protein
LILDVDEPACRSPKKYDLLDFKNFGFGRWVAGDPPVENTGLLWYAGDPALIFANDRVEVSAAVSIHLISVG